MMVEEDEDEELKPKTLNTTQPLKLLEKIILKMI